MSGPNPLLSPPFYVIPGIDPNAPISAQTEQIDQLNTLLLQEIDANFARFHQIVTSRILPEIKRFAIAGEPTREAAQFWRSFFEAASSIRTTSLEEPSIPSQQDISAQYEDQTMTLRRIHDDSSIISNNDQSGSSFIFDPPATSSTPLPNTAHKGKSKINESWEHSMESPFDRLDRKLRDDLKIGSGNFINDQSGFSSSDLPTPSLPSGYSLPHLGSTSTSNTSKSASLPSMNWNQSQEDEHEGYSTGTVDPQDIQRSQHTSHPSRPNSITPKANKIASASTSNNPFGPNFNGIVDIRSTPLNAKSMSKSKKTKKPPKQSILPGIDDVESSDEELPFGMSPPVTMKFSLPPKARAIFDMSRTPGKKSISSHTQSNTADVYGNNTNIQSQNRVQSGITGDGEKQAKYMIDDLLEEMGSELSPRLDTPEGLGRYSIMPGELQPGEGRLLFSGQSQHRQLQPVLQEEEEGEDQTYHLTAGVGASQDGRRLNRRSTGVNTSFGSDMIDLPVGQVYSAEDSFDNEDSFASDLNDDDDGVYSQPTVTATGSIAHTHTGTGTISSVPYSTHEHMIADDSYLSSEGDLTTTSEAGVIFGKQPNYLPQAHQRRQSTLAGVGPVQGHAPRKSHFELMKMEDMDTYHGGRLEDAAGNDVANSPTNALARGRGG
ncbi:hypothetical protein I204_06837 [Kwoniella mangroviensis CBS 8886]|uniref:uncharacterized protein n=1 Tax=Kwoniella mangroviensis CBS 8507 TaxID=1296122 RepID=UPI00080CE2E5|nr:uncharacterized protein I203_01191 [Kwoniella mangroviensis CBS 8507]OCF69334.1 hypothetical protein I203_01191 [Kwoniella mangroviensis CBS 8507]OCF72458.1 hypothetical protein I204_06837 [Kwoniella mangroviensis CBS 8886]